MSKFLTIYICFGYFCLIAICNINCTNFETNKVIIHRPSFAQNTHFGYSVAGFKMENDSW